MLSRARACEATPEPALPRRRSTTMIATAMPARKRRPGRPTIYTRTILNKICARIEVGESLRSICLDDAMPARSTVHRWLARSRQFAIIRRALIAQGLVPPGKTA